MLYSFLIALTLTADAQLPDGKGKDVVESSCADCHSLERIRAHRLDAEGWNGLVREMLENGAAINPNELKIIVDYLAKNFGPDTKVNINKAGAEEIGGVLKLTPADVAAITEYRTQHGAFKDLGELKKVTGLADKVEAKKALIEF